jgi:DivIVA domain-containing protein
MAQLLILLAVALVAAALAWGVAVLLLGQDQGLDPAEPDGRAVPLPTVRPLTETDLGALRFDTAARGYRMAQVDQALRRAAYDIGYKEELIGVLEAEVSALRDGRTGEADALRQAREAAQRPRTSGGRPVPVDALADDEPVEAAVDAGGEDPVQNWLATGGRAPAQPAPSPVAPAGASAPADNEPADDEPASADDEASPEAEAVDDEPEAAADEPAAAQPADAEK